MHFNQIYTDYYNQIKRTAKSFVKNEEDALDVTQDTFLQAYESADKFDDSYSLSTWLTQICMNKSRDKLRARKAERKRIVPIVENGEHLLDTMEDQASPDHIMIAEENNDAIFSSFSGLPYNIRQALTLRYVDEYSYKDIAEVMGIPINTAKTWVSRGKKQLLHNVSP